MRVFRRVIFPAAWLAVFAVIAVALVKIAFVDGLQTGPAVAGPSAEVAVPVVQASRGTVTNTVQVKATVQGDPAVDVRNTAAGLVTHIFLEPGAEVTTGAPLYQVRSEVAPELSASAAGPQSLPPTYRYTDVVAPASGELRALEVLLNQQVSVGEAVGSVDPGTFTLTGSIDAAQQYRLLAKPASAQVFLVGGPAPFTCPSVVLASTAATEGSGSGGVAGGVSRSVPYAMIGPGSSGGAPEQGGTPTGTLSCAVPAGIEVFAGLGATMTVTAGEAVDVVTVPLTAVEGSVKEGVVWLAAPTMDPVPKEAPAGDGSTMEPVDRPAGEPQQRKVQLGLNNGSVVEVVSGLTEGESILEFIPGAPAQVDPGSQFGSPAYPMGG